MIKTSRSVYLRDAAIIGLTQVFTALCGFLLLPLVTKALGPYEFGIWSQISTTVSLLTPLAVLGLSMSLVRFLSGEQNPAQLRDGFYSILLFVGSTGLILSLAVFLASGFIASVFLQDPSATPFIRAGAFLIACSALDQLPLLYFRIVQQTWTFALLTVYRTFGQLLMIVVFLSMGFGLCGVIGATLIASCSLFAFALYRVYSQIGFSIPSFSNIGEHVRFGLPLTPNALIRWITDSSDRYVIGFFLGVQAVGIYSAGYVLGSILYMLVTPIQFILYPTLSRHYNEQNLDEVRKHISYSLKYYLMLAIPAVFGLSLLADPLMRLLTTAEFVSGSIVVPFIALSSLLAGLFQIIINITHLVKKTQLNLMIHIIAASLNCTLNIFLIPVLGISGAAIATLVSYVSMVLVVTEISFKYISFYVDWKFVVKSIVSSCIMGTAVMLYSPHDLMGIAVTIVLGGGLYFGMLFLLNAFTLAELQLLRWPGQYFK